jgi:hypothetical protein
MLSLDEKIDRTQRLLRRLEEDAPLLARRVAELGPEHQESSKRFAALMMAQAQAELEKLRAAQANRFDLAFPAPAD